MANLRLTDEQLVARIAADDSAALAELYERYARLVFSLALRMLQERTSAEDAVQEVFAHVWRSARQYQAERGKFSSWLMAITRHQCIDLLRSRRARPVPCSTDAVCDLELASEDDPAADAVGSCEQERIRRALAQLPAEQWLVIELAYFEGLTQKEIAARCATPLGTVKSRTLLGMQKLRALLQEPM